MACERMMKERENKAEKKRIGGWKVNQYGKWW